MPISNDVSHMLCSVAYHLCEDQTKLIASKRCFYKPARPAIIFASTGTEVKATVIVPNSPMARLEKAAARGSVTSSNAVAIADEFPPSVTPLVM